MKSVILDLKKVKLEVVKNLILDFSLSSFYMKIQNLFSKQNEQTRNTLEISIIEGITRENNHLVSAYAGVDQSVQNYWILLLFKECSRKIIGKIQVDKIRITLKKYYPECSLLLVEDHIKNLKVIKHLKKAFVLPNYAQSYIDISQPMNMFPAKNRRYLSNTKRMINKHNLSFQMTQTKEAQIDFYDNYYLPYIGVRHKNSCMILRIEDIFSPRVPFKIIQIKKDDEVISAGVIHYKRGHVSYAFLGVKNGRYEYVKQGGLSSIYYFLIQELHKEGFTKLYLGGSPPLLTHTLTRHKIRMSAKHDYDFDYSNNKFTAFYYLRASEASKDFLASSPFVFQNDKGEMNGAICLQKSMIASKKEFRRFCMLLLEFEMKNNYIFELDKNAVPVEWYRELPENTFKIIKAKKADLLFFHEEGDMKKNGLQVIELQSDQYEKWDEFVDKSPQGDVFCYSWWLDTITKSNFKIIAILNCNEIQAGIPLAFDANGKINEPPLTRTLGPIYRKLENVSDHRKLVLHRKWLNLLLEKIDPEDVVQFCTHQSFTDWLPFRWNGYKQTTRFTYIINYKNKTENDIWNNLNSNRKRDINKAKLNNLRVEISDDFKTFYKLVEKTYQHQGIVFSLSYEDFYRLDQEISKRNKRRVFITFDENNHPHAGVYIVFNSKSSYNLLSGSDPQTRYNSGHTLAMWEAIRYFRAKTELFNFGGSNIQRIEKYFRGFGGTLTRYFRIFTEPTVIKEVVNEMPDPAPIPDNDFRYHFDHFMHHAYCLFDIVRKKVFRTRK